MLTNKNTLIKVITNGLETTFKLYGKNGFKDLSKLYMKASTENRIMYEPHWLGMNIIQLPNDVMALQECIWEYKPEMLIETGVALGGSLIFYASIMQNYSNKYTVVGIDIKVYQKNRRKIESHHLSKNIQIILGSSTHKKTIDDLKKIIKEKKPKKIMISLDSNHEYNHVVNELKIYSSLLRIGDILVVQDAAMDDISDIPSAKENWKQKGPKQAIKEFLASNNNFICETKFNRFGITASPNGFLKRIK
jgi:cephalosporin hydroxylase